MRSYKSESEWKSLIEMYEKSGLSISQFCRETNLKATTFRGWVKKYSKINTEEQPITKVPLQAVVKMDYSLIIKLDNIKLEVPLGIEKNDLKKIISALRESV